MPRSGKVGAPRFHSWMIQAGGGQAIVARRHVVRVTHGRGAWQACPRMLESTGLPRVPSTCRPAGEHRSRYERGDEEPNPRDNERRAVSARFENAAQQLRSGGLAEEEEEREK